LLDSIVNFGEDLPAPALSSALANAKKADLCLVLGSSLMVSPANSIPELIVKGRGKGGKLAICNLQPTPLDDLASSRIFSQSDELMKRVMSILGFPIPEFTIRRHLLITTSSKPTRLTIQGVDVDGTPVSFLQSVKLAYNRRVIKAGPFVFGFRGDLEVGTELGVELEFMGHYGEPNLEVGWRFEGDGRGERRLEYDPRHGVWGIEKSAAYTGSVP